MKILLRSIHTRQYLQSADTWTPSPENALDFQSIHLLLDFVRRRSLRHMELVLFDLPATINAVPIEKLNLAQLLDQEPVPAPTLAARRAPISRQHPAPPQSK